MHSEDAMDKIVNESDDAKLCHSLVHPEEPYASAVDVVPAGHAKYQQTHVSQI